MWLPGGHFGVTFGILWCSLPLQLCFWICGSGYSGRWEPEIHSLFTLLICCYSLLEAKSVEPANTTIPESIAVVMLLQSLSVPRTTGAMLVLEGQVQCDCRTQEVTHLMVVGLKHLEHTKLIFGPRRLFGCRTSLVGHGWSCWYCFDWFSEFWICIKASWLNWALWLGCMSSVTSSHAGVVQCKFSQWTGGHEGRSFIGLGWQYFFVIGLLCTQLKYSRGYPVVFHHWLWYLAVPTVKEWMNL